MKNIVLNVIKTIRLLMQNFIKIKKQIKYAKQTKYGY